MVGREKGAEKLACAAMMYVGAQEGERATRGGRLGSKPLRLGEGAGGAGSQSDHRWADAGKGLCRNRFGGVAGGKAGARTYGDRPRAGGGRPIGCERPAQWMSSALQLLRDAAGAIPDPDAGAP